MLWNGALRVKKLLTFFNISFQLSKFIVTFKKKRQAFFLFSKGWKFLPSNNKNKILLEGQAGENVTLIKI